MKKNGQREPFDRDNLARSIYIALRKRPFEPERVERIINSLVRQLESSGETDIPSDMIGGFVMEALASLDQVAYIRFASVYLDFKDVKEFMTELKDLLKTKETPEVRSKTAAKD